LLILWLVSITKGLCAIRAGQLVRTVKNCFLSFGKFARVLSHLPAFNIGRSHAVIVAVHQYMVFALAAGDVIFMYGHGGCLSGVRGADSHENAYASTYHYLYKMAKKQQTKRLAAPQKRW
jgi:hypothetical protein